MKNIFISILILISVHGFGQVGQMTRLYAIRGNLNGTKDSFYVHEVAGNGVYNSQGNYVVPKVDSINSIGGLEFPLSFGRFIKNADNIYRNFIPRAEAVDWAGVDNKPLTFPATATTIGGNLLVLSNPASNSLIAITPAGNATLRTEAQVKQDLLIDQVSNTSDATKNSASANLTNKTMGAFNAALDAGANDSYVITLSPAPAAYTTGMIIIFRANTVNTGAASINVNGLGVRTIVKRVNTVLANADIPALQWCMLVYDGTNFVLLNPVVN